MLIEREKSASHRLSLLVGVLRAPVLNACVYQIERGKGGDGEVDLTGQGTSSFLHLY